MSGALITYWEPEDTRSWDRQGSRIARRNLWISILCLILAFSTWVIWSIVVLKMPTLGFPYSKAQLFMLTALPSLSGATLRMVYSFLPAMVLATFGVLGFLPGRLSDGTPVGGNFWGFFLIFQLLFLLSGIGNGSVFRMIPVVFAALSLREAKGDGEAAQREAQLHGVTESAAATGLAGAIGAYGGFVIPNGFGASMNLTGSAEEALYAFMLFYLSCAVICWVFYARKHANLPC